jgi:Domain of unknown function (DUF397)
MHPELSRAQWRKSSYSGNSGNCVEVAQFVGSVAVRDSEDHPHGSALLFDYHAWHTFVRECKQAVSTV